MNIAKTYDSVSWHYPEGKGCPSIEVAKLHFGVIMGWLKEKNLLSVEGLEVVDCGIDSDFALTTTLLTPQGNRVLDNCYSQWVQNLRYGVKPMTDLLDTCLNRDVS